jgi:hypothetical protein
VRLLVPQSSCGFSAKGVERFASLLGVSALPAQSPEVKGGSERSDTIIPTLSEAAPLYSNRSVASSRMLPGSSKRSSVDLKREPAPAVPRSVPQYSEGQTLLARTVVVVPAGYFLFGVPASPRQSHVVEEGGR